MYIDAFTVGVLIYLFVGLWLGMGKTSPLHDWANDHPGWYSVLLLFGGPLLFVALRYLF